MAHRNQSPKLRAGGNIRPSTFVKVSTAAPHTCLQAGAGERTIGISQAGTKYPQGLLGVSNTYAAEAGDPIDVNGQGDIVRLRLGAGGCAAADLLISDASGYGVVASGVGTAVQWVGAVALEDGSEGDHVEVQILLLPVTLT